MRSMTLALALVFTGCTPAMYDPNGNNACDDCADADTDTDSDSDTDSDTDTDTDADGDADTDTDPGNNGGDVDVRDQYGDVIAEYDSCNDVDWDELCENEGDACFWQEVAAGSREVWIHWEAVADIDAEAPDNWIGWTSSQHFEGDDAAELCGVVYIGGGEDAVRMNNTSCPDEDSFDEEPWGEDAIAEGCTWLAEGQEDDEASLRRAAGGICDDGDGARTQADAWTWTGDNAGTGSHAIAICDDSFDTDDLENE